MLKEILWLLAGYLAIIGLVRVVALLVDLIAPPKAPQGCRLYLRVPEDADYTESSLIGCCRLLHRGETGGLPCTVELSCFMGSYQNYHVRVGNTLVKLAENDPRNKRIFRVGEQCHLTFAPDTVHVL